jgi:polyisoprenoid-binding protein YceI
MMAAEYQCGVIPGGPRKKETLMTEQPVDIPGYIAGTWDIDPVHSHIGFIARHLMVSKVRGNFTRFEGQIVTAANPLDSSATVTVDTSSLDTGNETRDNDVKSENFLDVANHPTMTFQSTGVHRSANDLIMTGDLTIKGVTRLVELGIEFNGFGPDPYGGTRAGFTGTGELYRSDYGITANTVLPTGGVVVSDEIQLVLDVEASLRTS